MLKLFNYERYFLNQGLKPAQATSLAYIAARVRDTNFDVPGKEKPDEFLPILPLHVLDLALEKRTYYRNKTQEKAPLSSRSQKNGQLPSTERVHKTIEGRMHRKRRQTTLPAVIYGDIDLDLPSSPDIQLQLSLSQAKKLTQLRRRARQDPQHFIGPRQLAPSIPTKVRELQEATMSQLAVLSSEDEERLNQRIHSMHTQEVAEVEAITPPIDTIKNATRLRFSEAYPHIHASLIDTYHKLQKLLLSQMQLSSDDSNIHRIERHGFLVTTHQLDQLTITMQQPSDKKKSPTIAIVYTIRDTDGKRVLSNKAAQLSSDGTLIGNNTTQRQSNISTIEGDQEAAKDFAISLLGPIKEMIFEGNSFLTPYQPPRRHFNHDDGLSGAGA